jgi:predicted DNA-binding transcriptional regulator AlpA
MQDRDLANIVRQNGSPLKPGSDLVTVEEFAQMARLSRRQIDRLRKRRPPGFPRELELSSGPSPHRNCPRFRRSEVDEWINSRALW